MFDTAHSDAARAGQPLSAHVARLKSFIPPVCLSKPLNRTRFFVEESARS
jgi:hypothetical protein